MNVDLDRQKVKQKAVDLAFAARAVIQQLTLVDASPETLAAREILEQALADAIPNGRAETKAAA